MTRMLQHTQADKLPLNKNLVEPAAQRQSTSSGLSASHEQASQRFNLSQRRGLGMDASGSDWHTQAKTQLSVLADTVAQEMNDAAFRRCLEVVKDQQGPFWSF